MKYELTQKQNQKLILTPQLYQSISILQMNLVELRCLIEKELIENPLLEIKQEINSISEQIDQKESFDYQSEETDKNKEEDNFINELNYLRESDFLPFLDKQVLEKDNKFEDFIYYKESLQDYLLAQLGTSTNNDIDYKIGEYLIGNINDNGYLTISLDDVSRDLNIRKDKIEEILFLVQNFEPLGVGARNLEECLQIQANSLGIEDVNILKIIKNHLVDLAGKSFQKIAKDLKISILEVQSIADIIKKTFDPKPGRAIGNLKEVRYVIPDLTIKKVGDEYKVVLNNTYLPQIHINPQYMKILDLNAGNFSDSADKVIKNRNISEQEAKDTIKYITEKLNSSKWLINSIEQRKKTIYRIAELLSNFQKDFLDKGILYIKPLTLKEIADRLDIHESTVSRAIHNKIVQTSRGFLKMKFFFAKGIETKSGNIVSSDTVKRLIKEYISSESHFKPWSDQKLADLLSKKRGINISRRTVAKYREELEIPSSNLRKRFEI